MLKITMRLRFENIWCAYCNMHFRVARHTNALTPLIEFYVKILGLNMLGEFKDHNQYDGIFIGRPELNWHLEFTKSNNLPVHTVDEDDILVFYPEEINEYEHILANFKLHHFIQVEPKNPYWKENGVCFRDPDGYPVVISPLNIKNKGGK